MSVMRLLSPLFVSLVLSGLTACSTPGHRAEQHAAVFGKLSRDDRELVLRGKVRPGMSKEAVYIAWGDPDWRFADSRTKGNSETWIYERQLSTYAPMGSYDQVYSATGLYGPRFAGGIQSGFGYGGIPNTGFLFSPRALLTDERFKRAEFIDDRLRRYEVRRGVRHLTATATGGT